MYLFLSNRGEYIVNSAPEDPPNHIHNTDVDKRFVLLFQLEAGLGIREGWTRIRPSKKAWSGSVIREKKPDPEPTFKQNPDQNPT